MQVDVVAAGELDRRALVVARLLELLEAPAEDGAVLRLGGLGLDLGLLKDVSHDVSVNGRARAK